MKTVIFAFSRQGIKTARRILNFFQGAETQLFVPERLWEPDTAVIPKPGSAFFDRQFHENRALIFVSSCGIAVREIAPFVHDKKTDPAVLCVDELGRFVIPLLSGHIGGANETAEKLSAFLGAQAIITTATDINHRFSVDAWAAGNGFIIGNMSRAKEVSAAILEKDIPLLSDLPVKGDLPNGTFSGDHGPIGVYLGWEVKEPFGKTLRIIPKILHLGIGCRMGASAEAIESAFNDLLSEHHIDNRAFSAAASIDLKANESGLLQFCREHDLPVRFYSAEILQKVPGNFSASDFVRKTTGVDNVCERAAMIGADRLIVSKTIGNGVTLAVAAEAREVRFE